MTFLLEKRFILELDCAYDLYCGQEDFDLPLVIAHNRLMIEYNLGLWGKPCYWQRNDGNHLSVTYRHEEYGGNQNWRVTCGQPSGCSIANRPHENIYFIDLLMDLFRLIRYFPRNCQSTINE